MRVVVYGVMRGMSKANQEPCVYIPPYNVNITVPTDDILSLHLFLFNFRAEHVYQSRRVLEVVGTCCNSDGFRGSVKGLKAMLYYMESYIIIYPRQAHCKHIIC